MRKILIEHGATSKEIDALIAVQLRLDSWILVILLLTASIVRTVVRKDFRILGIEFTPEQSLAVTLLILAIGIGGGGYLYVRGVRKWIAPHESRMDIMIVPNIRSRISPHVDTTLSVAFFIAVASHQFLLSENIMQYLASAILLSSIFVVVSAVKTGSWNIGDPISIEGEQIASERVLKSAGRVIGALQYAVLSEAQGNIRSERELQSKDLQDFSRGHDSE